MDSRTERSVRAAGALPARGHGARGAVRAAAAGLALVVALALAPPRAHAAAQGSAADWDQVYARLYGGECTPAETARIFEELAGLERPLPAENDARRWCLHLAIRLLAAEAPESRPGAVDAVGVFEGVRAELGGSDGAELALILCFEFLEAGRLAEAAELARYGLERYPTSPTEAALWSVVAEDALQAWNMDETRSALERGRAALAACGEPAPVERQLLAIETRLWIALGLPDLAIRPLERLRELDLSAGPEERELTLQVEVAWALATERFDEVIARLGDAPLSAPSRLALAIAHAERARTAGAYPAGAIALLEGLLADEAAPRGMSDVVRLRLAEIRLRAGEERAARALIESIAAIESPDPLDERLQLETLRARLELDAQAPPAVLEVRRSALEATFGDVLSARAGIELRSGGVGYLHFLGIRSALSELVELTRRLEGPEAALDELLAVRELGSLARSLGGPRATLAAIRAELLPVGGGILAYLPGTERSHVFLIDAGEVRCEALPALWTWNAQRQELQHMLMRPPAADEPAEVRARLDALLETLAQALLPASVQRALAAWTEVSVEGLGLAGYVPFEALPLASGQPLGLALPVTHLPSLGVATRLAERARAGPEPEMDLTVVAAPLDLEREPIPWGPRETGSLSAWCRSGRFALFAGAEATPAALRAPATSGASWLLLVLHGVYDAGRERAAGILLGRDAAGAQARLFAEDVESLRVPPLVFLAVCGAARGPLRRGDDGITDLGGAFLAAGAEAVVLSPIDLLLAPTLVAARCFQAELARGATPSRALHRARCALAERKEYAHPYHYALLHLVGIGHRPVYPAPLSGLEAEPSPWPWPAGLLLAALGLGAVVALRRLSRS